MSVDVLRERLAAIDSHAAPELYIQAALALANALSEAGQRPGGFADNARSLALLDSLEYPLLLMHDPVSELAYRKARFYTLGDRYDGDRELNLREAIADAQRALALLRAQPEPDEEQLGAFLNDMANCYLRANYAGSWPLERAAECCREGLAAVSPERFPRLHSMLTGNLAMTQQQLAAGRTQLPEHEMARRFDYDIQRAHISGGPAQALPEVWGYLHWAWSLDSEPNVHLVSAYTQLANYCAAMGHAQQSLPYVYCAIALCTSVSQPGPVWQGLLQQAHQVLEQILAVLNQGHRATQLSTSARGGFTAAREAWQAGNQFLTRNPAQAMQAYEHALHMFPLWPAGLHARGLAHLLLGNHSAAIDDFTASLQFLPNHPKTLLARSKAHALAGAAELAAADLARARELDPNIPAALTGKAGSGA